jgi:hypothetical protein
MEGHLQKVLGILEMALRINEGLASGLFVAVGGDGGELGEQAMDGDVDLAGVGGVERVLIERREALATLEGMERLICRPNDAG